MLLLEQRFVCFEAEERPAYAYFLDNGFASVVSSMRNGDTAEVEMIGNEGIVGGFCLLSNSLSPNPTRCFIQITAHALRISMNDMRHAFQTMPDVREKTSAFLQAEIAVLSQVAGCHRMHDAAQRLARWLLMAHDRVGNDVLRLTQEFLAEMLGTRRPTVTEIAGELQRLGYIEYHRGTVTIVNRPGLETAACECYATIRRIYQNI